MGTKLSLRKIKETPKEDWHLIPEAYSLQEIDDIPDPSGANTKRLLTAIPSPFARIHLFETAFNIVNHNDHNGKTAFHKLVSDCLDVFELLYNFNIHAESSNSFEIITWSQSSHLRNLNQSQDPAHKLLGDTLSLFLSRILDEKYSSEVETFYLFLYEKEVFAGSSPLTGFFTKSDIMSFPLINPSIQKEYFSECIPLHERNLDFQLYLHSLFNADNLLSNVADCVFLYLKRSINFLPTESRAKVIEVSNTKVKRSDFAASYETIKDKLNHDVIICGSPIYAKIFSNDIYSKSIQKLNATKYTEGQNIPLVLEDGLDSFGKPNSDVRIPRISVERIENRILPDSKVKYPYIVASDFLEDTLIQVNYPINNTKFFTLDGKNFNKDIDDGFLLPIKPKYFEYFHLEDLNHSLTITKLEGNGTEGYQLTLEVPIQEGKKVKLQKVYYENPQKEEYGKLVQGKFNFAVFPFFKLRDDSDFNNYYNLMFIDAENDASVGNKAYALHFYVNDQKISSNQSERYFYTEYQRNSKQFGASSTYYQIQNTHFDYLQVEAPFQYQNQNARGIIIPKWVNYSLGTKKFTIAVDFGTTNTHVAINDDPTNGKFPESLTVGENDMQVVQFNLPRQGTEDPFQKYENINSRVNSSLIPRQLHEFVPCIIGKDSKAKYRFPIRTATSEIINFNAILQKDAKVLNNINISFVYEKDRQRDDEEIITNLKWSHKLDNNNIARVEAFIKEIVLIIRNKIILNNGDPRISQVIWFRPLSLDEYSVTLLSNVWMKYVKEILQSNNNPICITESQAPYYYHKRTRDVYGTKPVLCIDIGGGSTDVVFFDNAIPKFGTSFNFAGNALWGSGFIGLNGRHNKLINNYHEKVKKKIDESANISEETRSVLKSLYETADVATKLRSEDLINLNFAWDDTIEFTSDLKKDPNVKFIILLHYSAIIYHCFQVMKFANLNKPAFIIFSGRGSRALNILDQSSDKSFISKYTGKILKNVFDASEEIDIKIVSSEFEKEATCLGGIFMQSSSDAEPQQLVYVGQHKFAGFNDCNKLKYGQIDESIKKEIIKNINGFLKMFFDEIGDLNIENKLGIKINQEDIRKFIKNNLENYLEEGLDYRLQSVKLEEEINETLFFYPVIKIISELCNNLYE